MKTVSMAIRFGAGGLPMMAVAAALTLLALTAGHAASQADGSQITVPLQEYDGSGVTGTAVLTAQGSAVQVSMRLSGGPVTGGHPTHIHTGTCENFDPNPLVPLVTFTLDPVDSTGVSETTEVDLSMADLLADDYVLLVHESPENLTHYLVCGEIPHHVDTQSAPSTGAGSGISAATRWPASTTALLLAFGALAAAGLAGRRWSARP